MPFGLLSKNSEAIPKNHSGKALDIKSRDNSGRVECHSVN